MNYELLFSLVGLLSVAGWGALLTSPWWPDLSDRIASVVVPVLLASAYVAVALGAPVESGSFAEVQTLFTQPSAVMAGWIHFLTSIWWWAPGPVGSVAGRACRSTPWCRASR